MPVSKRLGENLLKTALIQLKVSTDYKAKRFVKINEAIALLDGDTKKKLRTQFNVPLPVLQGLFETFLGDLDDPVTIKIKNNAGKNFQAIKGINEAINIAKKSLKNNALWDYKDRASRKFCGATGRAVLKSWSVANPYQNNLECVDPQEFHCQPKGGGILERHLFCGEEGIFKTKDELTKGAEDDYYIKENVDELLTIIGDNEYQQKLSEANEASMTRFKSLGLDPDSNNYVGEVTVNLCEWNLTKYGKRYHLLFDPWNKILLKADELKDLEPSGLYPYTSYATHEDIKVFWSTSMLADILMPIAKSIIDLFNQDLTNRQKRMMNAKLYDKDMIKNVAKLDEAQSRPDCLVPVDTFGGARRLSEATYAFQTPEMSGTVDLISWLDEFTGKATGIYQNAPSKGGKKNNNIVYAEIQQMTKRVDYRSHSYQECWGQVALRFISGLKENLTDKEALDMLGPELGFDFVKQLKEVRIDKDDIEIISTKEQAQEDALRKAQKEKALSLLGQDPGINPDWKRRHLLSDIGGFEQDEIDDALDIRGQGKEQDQLSSADDAIKDLIKGKEPEVCWHATTIFLRKIMDFAVGHKLSLDDKFPKFIQFAEKHNEIVMENMMQLALRTKAYQPPAQPGATPPNQPGAPTGAPGAPDGGGFAQKTPEPTMGGGQPTPVEVSQR